MLPSHAPRFYWNFISLTRDKILNVLVPDQVYELICATGKCKIYGRAYYPAENPPGTIETITSCLEHLGVFDRVLNKK